MQIRRAALATSNDAPRQRNAGFMGANATFTSLVSHQDDQAVVEDKFLPAIQGMSDFSPDPFRCGNVIDQRSVLW
ncbi:MAG: hypothetical protein KDA81_20410 [Planctomycetaceae bacterium]|nr:hypothetical protein [Planctomycetaceae bacterium]